MKSREDEVIRKMHDALNACTEMSEALRLRNVSMQMLLGDAIKTYSVEQIKSVLDFQSTEKDVEECKKEINELCEDLEFYDSVPERNFWQWLVSRVVKKKVSLT